jgi:hypothetical protein
MYWRNIVNFCKQKINLDSEVELLQGKRKLVVEILLVWGLT